MFNSVELWTSAGIAFATGVLATAAILISSRKVRNAENEFNKIPDGISGALNALASAGLVIDRDLNVIQATRSAFALGLVRETKIVNSKLVSLVEKALASKVGGKAKAREFSLESGIGDSELWVNARAVNLGEGFALLLVEDRTESHTLDETRRDFVANISHELKTPIGAVGLLAEAIQSAADDPTQVKKFAKNLEFESQRLTQLVQDIIQLSRVQAAEVIAASKPVNLTPVIHESMERNQVAASKKKIKLRAAGSKDVAVYGDHELLTVAIKNLIENAVTYSDVAGDVSIVVSDKRGIVEIKVKDRGAGISPEEQDRIFERFYRVDPSRSRQTGGTGLGLAIVKNIAQKHLGEVLVKSKVGGGSTFTLRIPSAKISNEKIKGLVK